MGALAVEDGRAEFFTGLEAPQDVLVVGARQRRRQFSVGFRCVRDSVLKGERDGDGRDLGLAPAELFCESLEAIPSGLNADRFGCVEVGALAGAGEGDVGAFLGAVVTDYDVGGVDGLSLGGERVLNVGEPQVSVSNVLSVQSDGVAAVEAKLDTTLLCIDARDL